MSWDRAFSVWNGSAGDFIGSGVSREAFRIGGEVYKVENDYYATNGSRINYFEAAASAFLRENFKIPGVIWPNFKIHTMPDGSEISESIYVPKEVATYPPIGIDRKMTWLFNNLQIRDAAWGINVFYYKGFVIPIDLGYWALERKAFWDPNEWVRDWESTRRWQEEEMIRVRKDLW